MQVQMGSGIPISTTYPMETGAEGQGKNLTSWDPNELDERYFFLSKNGGCLPLYGHLRSKWWSTKARILRVIALFQKRYTKRFRNQFWARQSAVQKLDMVFITENVRDDDSSVSWFLMSTDCQWSPFHLLMLGSFSVLSKLFAVWVMLGQYSWWLFVTRLTEVRLRWSTPLRHMWCRVLPPSVPFLWPATPPGCQWPTAPGMQETFCEATDQLGRLKLQPEGSKD